MAKRLKKIGKNDNCQGENREKQVRKIQAKLKFGSTEKVAIYFRIAPDDTVRVSRKEQAEQPESSDGLSISEWELKDFIRAIVREEIFRLQSQKVKSAEQLPTENFNIDRLADDTFTKYDDVFKALA